MAWTDEPTKAQINAIYGLIRWKMPMSKLNKAIAYLENKSRREVSDELARLRHLYITHSLNRDNCFDGKIWEDFRSENDSDV